MMIIGIDPFIVYGAIAVCLIFLLRLGGSAHS
jgi:hypothetical protein